jgi:putative transposase
VVTATLDDVTKKKAKAEPSAQEQVAEELVRRAREQGLSLTGPDGLLKQLTKTVLETALNQEMTEHLAYDKHARPGNETGNVRNGTRSKTVLTEGSGQVPVEVPRAGRARLSRRSSASGSGGCRGSMRWCCRCMPRG